MRNILTALLCTVGIGVASALGIGIAIIGFPTTAEPFEYKWCDSFDSFVTKAENTGGVFVVGGETPIGTVSVIGWPDGSFAIAVYLEETDEVCFIETGTFASVELIVPGAEAPVVIPKAIGDAV